MWDFQANMSIYCCFHKFQYDVNKIKSNSHVHFAEGLMLQYILMCCHNDELSTRADYRKITDMLDKSTKLRQLTFEHALNSFLLGAQFNSINH